MWSQDYTHPYRRLNKLGLICANFQQLNLNNLAWSSWRYNFHFINSIYCQAPLQTCRPNSTWVGRRRSWLCFPCHKKEGMNPHLACTSRSSPTCLKFNDCPVKFVESAQVFQGLLNQSVFGPTFCLDLVFWGPKFF